MILSKRWDVYGQLPQKIHLKLMSKGKNFTLKQKTFIKRAVETLNPTQAASEAYHTKNPDVIAAQNMANPSIRQAIEHELDEAGIPRQMVLKQLGKIIRSEEVGKNPKASGVAVAAANTVGKWAGWEATNKIKVEMPEIPKSAEEIDIMLVRMRRNSGIE